MTRESGALRLYRRLLRAYPKGFRAEYGEEILGTFADRYYFSVR